MYDIERKNLEVKGTKTAPHCKQIKRNKMRSQRRSSEEIFGDGTY